MMTRESPRHIEQVQRTTPVSIEKAVRRIWILTDLSKEKKPLNEKEKPAPERNVDAWLTKRFVALAIPPREMPRRVAQWIYESAQKNEEQKDYGENEWQWLQEEKKKPEGERDFAYVDRLSVYCMLVEDAALARKWLADQNKIFKDKDASPLKRTKARDTLLATRAELEALKERSAPLVALDIGKGLEKMKESAVYLDLLKRFQELLAKGLFSRAKGFIRERMYSRLKKVYNGTVPEEAYNRLIAELEEKVRVRHEEYDATVARIASEAKKREEARRLDIAYKKRQAS